MINFSIEEYPSISGIMNFIYKVKVGAWSQVSALRYGPVKREAVSLGLPRKAEFLNLAALASWAKRAVQYSYIVIDLWLQIFGSRLLINWFTD